MRTPPKPYLLALAALLACPFAPHIARADLTYINTIGGPGGGNGQFNNPIGVAIGAGNTLYVVDTSNNRVQLFTASGTFISSFGSPGSGNGQFSSPVGIAIGPGNTIYVDDNADHRVEIFNATGVFQGEFGSSGAGNGQFSFSTNVAASPAGNVYVDDISNVNVQIFNAAGAFQSAFGGSGTGNGKFNLPTGIAVSPAGDIYVGDGNNGRVQIFSSTGIFESSFGTHGNGTGQFGFAAGIAIAPNGYTYVEDATNNRIEVFTPANIYQSSFGSLGNGTNQLSIGTGSPGMAVLPNGFLYAADQNNNRVQRLFDPNAWSAGTNNFTDATTGPTNLAIGANQILGQNFTLTSAMGLTLAGNLTINSGGTFNQAGGPLNAQTLTISGRYVYQGGTTNLANLVVASGGLVQANLGGSLTMTTSLSIFSTMTLDGGVTLSAPTASVGAGGFLSVGNASILASSLTITSGAQVQLNNSASSLLLGVNDFGSLSGGGIINGPLIVQAGGQLSVPLGQTLTTTGSNTNAGLLAIAGGTAHFLQAFNNGSGVSFIGSIQGFGTLRFDGGLTSTANSTISLAGSASIFGNVTNNGAIRLQGTQPNVFFNNITNNGSITVDIGSSAIFYGSISGNVPSSAVSLALNSSVQLITPHSAIATSIFALAGAPGNWTASLDLNGGALVLESTPASKATTLDTLRSQILFAKSNPAGITSSGLPANMALATLDNAITGFTTFFGQPVDANSLLVAPELLGDTNADGHVDLADLSTVLNNFGAATPAWTSGNFDNTATIDLTDLAAVLNNFGATNTNNAAATPTAAPEPASLSLLVPLIASRLRRRPCR